MPTTTYINPWHKPGKPEYGPAIYESKCKPESYRGYLIYEGSLHVEIVLHGVAVSQCGSVKGAKAHIDTMLHLSLPYGFTDSAKNAIEAQLAAEQTATEETA